MRAFFSHHQGMSLVALANVVCDDVFVHRFHADPRVKATELLLQERVPREAIVSEPRPAEGAARVTSAPLLASRRFRSPHTANPHTHFLSNGRYTAAVTHAGGGFSTWRGLAVTRQREDRTSDAGSHYIYLRDPWSGEVWSPTYLPSGREPDEYEVTFELDKATYVRRDGDFETRLQIAVSPEDDVEVRRLSITNHGDRAREIEVTSYAEIVLGKPEDDLAHPAFGKLFVETEHADQNAGLLFSRRQRSADEESVLAFHVLGVEGRLGGAVEWETDRAQFIGRGRSPANPIALDGRRAVGNDRRGARPDRGAARPRAPHARARSCASRSRPASRRIAIRRSRWSASIATAARLRAPSRWRSRTRRSRCGTWGSPTTTRCSHPGSRRGSSALTLSGVSPAALAPESLRPAQPVGLRDLRRPAHRAGVGDGA